MCCVCFVTEPNTFLNDNSNKKLHKRNIKELKENLSNLREKLRKKVLMSEFSTQNFYRY